MNRDIANQTRSNVPDSLKRTCWTWSATADRHSLADKLLGLVQPKPLLQHMSCYRGMSMHLLVRLFALASMVLVPAGCFGGEQGHPRADAGRVQAPCVVDVPAYLPASHGFNFLDTDTNVYRQGGRIKMTARRNMQPSGIHDLPLDCVGSWSVSGPARFDQATRTVIINENAPVGSDIVVTAYAGPERLSTQLTVIGRDTIVLTGTRSQKAAAGCESADPVRELEFGPAGRFSVTFMPFESYRDYWGTYRFDASSGSLEMKVEGGNFVPPALDLEGRARLEGSNLILEDVFLGSRNSFVPQGSCRYTF